MGSKSVESERLPSATGMDEASWLKRITEMNVKQERLLNLHLDGDITTSSFVPRALSWRMLALQRRIN
jgi:hypothetical protein